MEITKKAAECFTSARKNLLEGAKLLSEIKEKELWKGDYVSFNEYLQEGCRVSPGFASKLVQVYEHFCLQGKVAPKELADVDTEKLYMASKLPGTHEKQLSQAITLSRSELKSELKDPEDECRHEDTVTICSGCHKRV